MKPLSDYEQKQDPLWDNCPVRAALDVIRGRWKPSILYEISEGAVRFGDLKDALPGITSQALSVQLRQLEADGVLTRTVYPEIPARVEYALTSSGRSLSDVMCKLDDWGKQYLAQSNRVLKRRSA